MTAASIDRTISDASTDLPPVERRAAMPGRAFMPAGWPPGSRRPDGRTSPLVVTDRRVRPPRPRCSPRTRSRPRRSASRGPTSRRLRRPARRVRLGAGRGLDERLRQCGDRPAGDADQEEVGRLVAAAPGHRRGPHPASARPGSSARACRSTRSPLASMRSSPGWPPTMPCLEAAAAALRTTDSVTKLATTTVALPAAGDGGTTRAVRARRSRSRSAGWPRASG